jgi:uncharacterized damage-inducible protein DinB
MALSIDLDDLLAYTDWQREKWHAFLRQYNEGALQLNAGPNGDGRFTTIGDLVKHIFSAEKRYVDRLSNRPLTDPASISNGGVDALFAFGQQSRRDLRELLNSFPARGWDVAEEHKILTHKVLLTPRKIVVHVVLHEIRHWAQIATLLRLTGKVPEFQDFLGSPVYGDPRAKANGLN